MKQRIRHAIYFIILLAIDQTTKYWARTYLKENGPIDIIPGALKLQFHKNSGAIWGILQGQIVFLVALTIILLSFLVFAYIKIPKDKKYNPLRIIWVFIMAGAIGNFIDRISYRYVVDFIYFSLIDFPLFNFADSCLTVSSIVMMILALFYYKDKDFEFVDGLFKRKKKKQSEHDDTGKDA